MKKVIKIFFRTSLCIFLSIYNLSRFYEIGTKEHALENLIFMYFIEIAQTDPEELWEYYKGQTDKSLTEAKKQVSEWLSEQTTI